jgi:hypothetical protein
VWDNFTFIIPEPAAIALLALAGAMLMRMRRPAQR